MSYISLRFYIAPFQVKLSYMNSKSLKRYSSFWHENELYIYIQWSMDKYLRGGSRFQTFGLFLPFFTNYRVLSTLYGFKLQLYTSLNYFCTPQASFSLPSIFSTHFWSFSHGTLSKVPKTLSGELFPLPDQKWPKKSKIFNFFFFRQDLEEWVFTTKTWFYRH